MLSLTAPRVHQKAAPYYRSSGLTPQLLQKIATKLGKELAKKRACTREEIAKIVGFSGGKLSVALIYVELEQVICSGPKVGKQLTYTGIDDWVAPAKPKSRDDALAELSRRFFESHGPAKDVDFANWSGLTLADARRFEAPRVKERSVKVNPPLVHLLPNFDEFFIGYKDRADLFDSKNKPNFLSHVVSIDGQLVGGWRRKGTEKRLDVNLSLGRALTKPERASLEESARELQRFTGTPVHLTGT